MAMEQQGLSSRLCALNTLFAVFEKGSAMDQSLDHFAKKYNLTKQDKSFAHALCAYVLRYYEDAQTHVNRAANRSKKIAPPMLNIVLLMGLIQIDVMGVPDHAAVDTSVELAKKVQCAKQKNMVNAVLRRLLREREGRALKTSLPEWLVQSWVSDYGDDVAAHITTASQAQAQTGMTNKNGEWAIIEGELDLTPDIWVQDFASHYPVSLLPDLTGKRVLDLCAAPGGKTMQLAAKGASVTAVDISEKRLRRLTENLERTGLNKNVQIECIDILKYAPKSTFDIVMLDAPCSATGTIRRHPDLPFIRTQKDIDGLVDLQAQLLNRIAPWVADGGLMMYCTCSLQKSEGEEQVQNFLNNHPEFKRDALSNSANPQFITTDGDVRLLPHYGDMDGFFVSYLRKSV